MSRLTVAVAQIESRLGDLPANLEKHLDFVERARQAGAQALLFPEMSLTGHGAGGDTLHLAVTREHALVQRIAELSGPMVTLFGLIEEGPAAQFYNAMLAVNGEGLIFQHRKINLATYGRLEDGKHFAVGRYVETFPLQNAWRAGLLICADLWNPALVHLTAVHGATLLFAPISSAVEAVGAEFDNPGGWDTACRFYAMVYGLPLVMANRVGREGDLSFWGGSRILDPFGRVLAQAGETEELLLAELDYQALRQARYLLPTVRDSNLGLVARESQRLLDIVGVPEAIRKG